MLPLEYIFQKYNDIALFTKLVGNGGDRSIQFSDNKPGPGIGIIPNCYIKREQVTLTPLFYELM
ncbi:hypothetical protein [Nostoc sp. FACHB-110]|uniref:hypothetical protein n=1 Tax=Nostoc sp. FACHB-110 TaxID=2692834 RepID=UPI0016845C94|nr:hypothetical protein [Nostoc sp. FACHB-110]MBD2437950.1 hypothetical protein [Nostoc sp. FACHB-110]